MCKANEQKRLGNWVVRLEYTPEQCGANVSLHTNNTHFDEVTMVIYHVFETDAQWRFNRLEKESDVLALLIEGFDMEEHFEELQAELSFDWR